MGEVLIYIVSIIIGYIIGRIGDYFFGYLNFFHHWTYGLLIALIGLFIDNYYGFIAACFGIGLIISDMRDMVNFRIYGRDKNKRFWGVD